MIYIRLSRSSRRTSRDPPVHSAAAHLHLDLAVQPRILVDDLIGERRQLLHFDVGSGAFLVEDINSHGIPLVENQKGQIAREELLESLEECLALLDGAAILPTEVALEEGGVWEARDAVTG